MDRDGLIALIVAAAIGGGGTVTHYARKEAPATIVINGEEVYRGPATFRNDRVMFPLDFAEGANIQAWWDKENGIAVLHVDDANVAVKAENQALLVFLSEGDDWLAKPGRESLSALGLPFDPQVVRMETAPLVEDGQLLLPLRVIAASLHADPFQDVRWVAQERTAYITAAGWTRQEEGADCPKAFTAPRFLLETFEQAEKEVQSPKS